MPPVATRHHRAPPRPAAAPVVDRAAFDRVVKADVVILSRAEYDRLFEMAELAADMLAIRETKAAIAAGETLIPNAVAMAILDGTHPVKAWRKHRRLTIAALAAKIGASAGQISMIENRKGAGSVAFLGRLAKVFGCTAGDLVED